ncbi:MAG TPA: SDR family oxidoreductase, partial [Myxococcota bacterium]|nr:SDR family oxidoreductase [Myxococcota bacterium]
VRRLLERGLPLALLARPAAAERLRAQLDSWPAGPRPWIVPGDLVQPDLGLSPGDRARLRAEARAVVHLGAAYDLFLGQAEAERTNTLGTRHLLALARELEGLEAFHHVSTIAVSGDFSGLYREADLDLGQRFPHAYGRSKFLAEQLVRASGLPWRIYRPGVVVGDSRTGEFDKLDGPYYALRLLAGLRRLPGSARMPMLVPRDDDALFHLVPVDFVSAALAELVDRPAPAGGTFHLVDPQPVSFRRFYLEALELLGFRGPRIPRPVRRLFRLLTRPGFWQVSRAAGRALGVPAEMIPHLLCDVRYDCAGASAALGPAGVRCPPLLDYLPRLVARFEASRT